MRATEFASLKYCDTNQSRRDVYVLGGMFHIIIQYSRNREQTTSSVRHVALVFDYRTADILIWYIMNVLTIRNYLHGKSIRGPKEPKEMPGENSAFLLFMR